jgi:hypothetical protein
MCCDGGRIKGLSVSKTQVENLRDDEDLDEADAKELLECGSARGLKRLRVLQSDLHAAELPVKERQFAFIRTQPHFVTDQKAGRECLLLSGHLVWAPHYVRAQGRSSSHFTTKTSRRVQWWPAQLYTPQHYLMMVEIDSEQVLHHMCQNLLKDYRPDMLLVVFLDKERTFKWITPAELKDYRQHRVELQAQKPVSKELKAVRAL